MRPVSPLLLLLLVALPGRPAGGGPAGAAAAVSPPATVPLEAPKSVRPDAEEAAFDEAFRRIFAELKLENGLMLDRHSDRDTVSCAATGFAAYSLALMAERGAVDRAETAEFVRRGFRTTLAATPERNRGWLYHFTDGEGRPKPWSEVSTIDSAIFYFGFLRAAETLKDGGFLAEVRLAIGRVDTEFMMRDGYFLHGLRWAGDQSHFIPHRWDDNSEGVILYRLFDLRFEPRVVRFDYPLFVYYYPLCFFDDPGYAGYLREAIHSQVQRYGYTGVTAGDSPNGYTAGDPQLISPLALFALSGLFAEARATLAEYGVDHMVPTYHVGSRWTAPDRVTIDYASVYILLARPGSPMAVR